MNNRTSHEGTMRQRLTILWAYSRGYRLRYLLAAAGQAGAAMARTGTFFLLGYLVDDALGASAVLGLLPGLAGGIIGLALLEGGCSFLSGRFTAEAAEGIARRLKDRLYAHIQALPFAYHDRMPTGELVQRCTSDVDAVRRFFADQAIGVLRIVLLFVVNFVAVSFINPQLALESVVVVPLVVIVSVFFFRRVSAAYDRYQDQDALLSTTLQENLVGVRVVRAFARQEYETAKFEKENLEKYRRGKVLLLMHSLFWPSTDILCASQVLAGYTIGALMVIHGPLTLGEYVSYAGLVVNLIWPMRDLGRLVVHASGGLVSAYRTMEILSQPVEDLAAGAAVPAEAPARGAVEFENVSFEFDPSAGILHGISFRAEPGQIVALLGPTGSGKTALVNLLPRFYDYTGSIRLDGRELRDCPKGWLRSQIGIVEQEPFLFSRTVRGNIVYGVGREVPQAEVEEAARAAAIHDVIRRFPEGYETLVGEKGVTLSGGQKQRIAVARALLKDPRILILDDSTSAVDSETEAAIREALERLMRGRTTFVIAHRVQSVMRADLILVLDRGRVIQRGTHESLLAEEGFYRRVFDLQSRVAEEARAEMRIAAEAWEQA